MGSQADLPEDILCQIHSLLPIRDAARVACVSRTFLHSWRSFPHLIMSIASLGIKENAPIDDLLDRVDHIMQNHSGMGMKTLSINIYSCSDLDPSYVDRWLRVPTTPGIKEFLLKRGDINNYNFPDSFLFSQMKSIQSFSLSGCSFHPVQAVQMSSLTDLKLHFVHITGEELYRFLSSSYSLVRLELSDCNDVVCLKIPCLLEKLDTLIVMGCKTLEMIDSSAPNLSTFYFSGRPIHISLGDASQLANASVVCYRWPDALYYASTKLPFIAPNIQTLVLSTSDETVKTPIASGKFLKSLEIIVSSPSFSPDYDFCSLLSFVDASPALESLIVRGAFKNSAITASRLMITGFCSAKSMIELRIRIIEKTKAPKSLTLDTTRGHDRRFFKIDKCWLLNKGALVEAEKARIAIQRFVKGRVPSAVNLEVIEPCSKCVLWQTFAASKQLLWFCHKPTKYDCQICFLFSMLDNVSALDNRSDTEIFWH